MKLIMLMDSMGGDLAPRNFRRPIFE